MNIESSAPEGTMLDNPQMPCHSKEEENPNSEIISNKNMCLIKPSWSAEPTHLFKFGIIIHSFKTTRDTHISAIGKPSTQCSLSTLVVLEASEEGEGESTQPWLQQNNISEAETSLKWGEAGCTELFESNVDAVYIIVPAE
jgi:hypothetical protein